MRLGRVKTPDGIKPVAYDMNGALRDLSSHIADISTTVIAPDKLAELAQIDISGLPEITGTAAPFLADVRRIFCIGLNYYDHAKEMGMAIPEHPILFVKACEATGATDPIVLPKGSEKTDWELELGVLIGSRAHHVSEDKALDHVAGYFMANDVSERHYQMELGGQWVKGKSADSFAPVGPYFVTKDAISDPQNLKMSLEVNGETMQNGSTATMIFNVPQIIAHVSRFITLHPGDLFLTGTPPGVGSGKSPQRYLKAGDVVTAKIEDLGEMRHEVEAFAG
ncbi:fumarylacetoacetate hydrolase family protein [Yoonia litorea]|uniref:2-keto-4-pentenoate hydratase/2-oxohepta-3-ene-1,7-dioic acid hydratase (Catechol pathway) n=1 Tax=Yoonia litorea TaxID=1123755 RepID=A0A1I6MZH7_9RHOB|nr:fumarylacetoacetate hydrolase family protein [Yoonia litorea]SFS20968.1 2-keto-4-pentenoate hydratase/2-oxohepta-3-ene-1,7-dioic acid hydratase (catechol pathway) [Yoonia litorea]